MGTNDSLENGFSAEDGIPAENRFFSEDSTPAEKEPSSENDMENLTIEDAFAQLEEIVRRMEEEGISLEESFSCYERGIRLVRFCNEQIDRVEKKVRVLQGEDREPF